MTQRNEFPPGWDEERVREVLEYYERQSDEEAAAEHEAALSGTKHTLMEVPMKLRVAPGDNSASYLMNKLLGVDMATDTEQMPLEGTPLCEARLNAVRAWIDAGAPTE